MSTPSPASPLQLPDKHLFRQHCRHDDGWSDHYGALHEASAYAGLVMAERYRINAIWQHGCFGPWEATSPGPLVYNSPAAKRFPLFVARQEEAAFLHAHGYPQARAIGVPLVYAPDPGLPRLPRILLVMPTHTLTGAKFDDRTPFERYAAEIKSVASQFDRVVVCVHPSCRQNGLWIREFGAHGFEIVDGAQTNDRHALRRMRALFAQCESVTSNGWGSHIAYALAFGAKVSIWGTEVVNTVANAMLDLSWSVDRTSLDAVWSDGVRRQKREYLQRLFREPRDGLHDVAWGRWLVGADHRLEPAAMSALLPTLVDPAPCGAGLRPPRAGAGRVLFVTHETTRTGAPMFLLHLLRWLRANTDLSFDLLAAKGGALLDDFAQVTIVHEPKDFAENPEWWRGYDLIYANTVCNGNLLEELGCGTVPVITHVHELDMGYHWLGARAMAGVIRQSSHYIACAQAVATRMQAVFNLPADRFSVHYEMIDAARVTANAATADVAQLRRDYDLPENALVVTACGTFDQRKAPDLFVQLAARVQRAFGTDRPLRFLWIGAQHAADLVNTVREDIRKLGLTAEIRLIGELPSPHGLIALSDLFCLTSREDPFPLVMLEAALLGKPVLCFDGAGGAGEFCAAGGGLAVPYLDVVAMAERVAELLRDPARRAEVGRTAAVVVRTRFSVTAIAPGLWRELQRHLAARLPLPAGRSPDVSLADLFRQWNLASRPQSPYIAAHLARQESLRQARSLVAEGRKREALQGLIKVVSADLATKHPLIICECLMEVAREMETLDPRQAAALLTKAREVSATTGIKLAQFQPRATARAAA